MQCFTSLINQWPKLSVFAADIGVSEGAAKQMRRRNSISPEYWEPLLEAAKSRGIEISPDALVRMASEKSRTKQ